MIEGLGFLMVYAWLACAFLSGGIAQAKGRSGFLWLVVGLLFGFFGLIAAAGMPTLREEIELAEWREERREERRRARMRPQMSGNVA